MAKNPTTTAEAEKTASAFPPKFLVVVHSRGVDGFRRGGRAFPAGRSEHPIETFDEEQLAAIQAEPLLSVEIVEVSGAELFGAGGPAPEDGQ